MAEVPESKPEKTYDLFLGLEAGDPSLEKEEAEASFDDIDEWLLNTLGLHRTRGGNVVTLSPGKEGCAQEERRYFGEIERFSRDEKSKYEEVHQEEINARKERIKRMKKEYIGKMPLRRARVQQQVAANEESSSKYRIKDNLTEEEWKNVPYSKWKILQELFCDSKDYRTVEGIEHAENLDRLPLSLLIFDIERMPDRFMADLGLLEIVPREKKSERLRKKIEALPQFKEILEKTVPFSYYDGSGTRFIQRMQIIQGVQFNPSMNGKLIIAYHSPRNPRERFFQVTDLDNALRHAAHIENGYEEEIRSLSRMEAEMREVIGLLNYRASDPEELKQRNIDQAGIRMRRVSRRLTWIVDHNKGIARDVLKQARIQEAFVKVKAPDGADEEVWRRNPSATAAKILRAVNNLRIRFRLIVRKGRAIKEGKDYLSKVREDARSDFDLFYGKLKTYDWKLERLKKKGDFTELETEFYTFDLLNKLRISPYNHFAERLVEKIKLILERAREEDFKGLQNNYIKAFLIAKLERLYRNFQLVRDDMTRPLDIISIDRIGRILNMVKKGFGEKQVLEEYVVDSYIDVFDNLQEKIEKALKILAGKTDASIGDEEKEKLLEELKKFLKEIDFVEIVRGLD
ncbi:MAG TPA: hypothetical protein ENI70_01360 [Candidatus Peregrinibacteria bacterium]|nr:hypothetical protein [Candidatus Peregrinibacteria bacterium]